jgi:6-phosphogluconate dehydrogenase
MTLTCETVGVLQNMALNVAEKGFPISVYNRSYDKTEAAVRRAQKEGR